MQPLSADERRSALAELGTWNLDPSGQVITRELKFADFPTAFGFMAAVAIEAQALDHHPDWSNSWATVIVNLTSHSAGGLTELDLALARKIDLLAARFGAAVGG